MALIVCLDWGGESPPVGEYRTAHVVVRKAGGTVHGLDASSHPLPSSLAGCVPAPRRHMDYSCASSFARTVTSVLLLHTPDPGAPALAADFESAGFSVRGTGNCAHLVRETLRAVPDVLVCWAPRAGRELLDAVATLQAQQPVPVLFFTDDTDVELMRHALDAGVHTWVVQGYAPQRLRALVHLAQAREARERRLRARLAELDEKLDERKWVDRAKGILMRARSVSEEQAFQMLRTASMQANQKVGQLSRRVIDAARVANAINRAGQQRMLSQRLVKLYALACAGTDAAGTDARIAESVARAQDNLAALAADLPEATYGDLVAAARGCWGELHALLQGKPDPARLPGLDALAGQLLRHANALVLALESSGLAAQVGVINISGRQRMLAQRMAKLALLRDAGLAVPQSEFAETAAAFEQGMDKLRAAPLSTPEIRIMLGRGEGAWQQLLAAAARGGREQLAAASEELLALFDALTEAYQHSIQLLIGRP
jgi:AmiR/NasT family two-component response regulator